MHEIGMNGEQIRYIIDLRARAVQYKSQCGRMRSGSISHRQATSTTHATDFFDKRMCNLYVVRSAISVLRDRHCVGELLTGLENQSGCLTQVKL